MPKNRYTPEEIIQHRGLLSSTPAKAWPSSTPAGSSASLSKMREQFLNGELFYTLKEAQIIIERWRIHYNTVRPHSSLGGQPPAPETLQLAS
jgi:transposase InsO family protein